MIKRNKKFVIINCLLLVFPSLFSIVSCKKNSSYNINFGNQVNCLDKKQDNYHHLSTIKKVIKTKADRSTDEVIKELPKWDDNKSKMFFDLIASLSFLNDNQKFIAKYEQKNENFEIDFTNNIIYTGKLIYYADNESLVIYLRLSERDFAKPLKSYTYQDTTYKGEE